MYFQIYIPYMIYVYATIYGLFKTVKMTFNTRKKNGVWRKKMAYGGSLCKTYLQDYPPFSSSLHVSIII